MKVGNLGIEITPRVVLFVATNFSKPGIIKSVGYVFRSVFMKKAKRQKFNTDFSYFLVVSNKTWRKNADQMKAQTNILPFAYKRLKAYVEEAKDHSSR